jgi:hypothetical protein
MTLSSTSETGLPRPGELPTDDLRVRRNALRIAGFIEYTADLDAGEWRETLVACRRLDWCLIRGPGRAVHGARPKSAACANRDDRAL